MVIVKEPVYGKTEDLGMENLSLYRVTIFGRDKVRMVTVEISKEASKAGLEEAITKALNSSDNRQLNVFETNGPIGIAAYTQVEKAIDILQLRLLSQEGIDFITDNYIQSSKIESTFKALKEAYSRQKTALKGLHLRFAITDGTDVSDILRKITFTELLDVNNLLGPKVKINPKSQSNGTTEFELFFD